MCLTSTGGRGRGRFASGEHKSGLVTVITRAVGKEKQQGEARAPRRHAHRAASGAVLSHFSAVPKTRRSFLIRTRVCQDGSQYQGTIKTRPGRHKGPKITASEANRNICFQERATFWSTWLLQTTVLKHLQKRSFKFKKKMLKKAIVVPFCYYRVITVWAGLD